MANNNINLNGKKPIRKFEIKFNLNPKNLIIFIFFGIFALSFFLSMATTSSPTGDEISLSQALTDIKNGKTKEVFVDGDKIVLTYNDNGKTAFAYKETGDKVSEVFAWGEIDPSKVNLVNKDQSISRAWGDILATLLPLGLMALFFFFIIRQARGAQDSIFSFGQSKARLFDKGRQSVTFKDVAGVDEAKKELEEIVDFLKHPIKYRALGARTPKGALLVGPSGCGKTLLAKAVAGEAGVPFFSMAGSEFMEMLVGVGAARVRDLFLNAKKAAPSIIFIDEIDSIGRVRGNGMAGGHDEREQTLNQILVEMDGFTPNDSVMVVAATNRGDLLDPALLRPGRFDRRIVLDLPDLEARNAILSIHARGKPFEGTVDWAKIAKRTVGFSGADLENMLNEAAILAAREDKHSIGPKEIDEAALKVKLGPAKKRLQTDEDKKMTAYHEAGHAITSYFLPNMDPVSRISIVARGGSLGHTLNLPTQDRTHETKTHLLEQMVWVLGGRAAEEVVFNEQTTGAMGDIEQATRVARAMVIDLGMSDLGPINLGTQSEFSDMGRPLWMDQAQLSPDMASKVDAEVKKIIDTAFKQATNILKKQKSKLDLVASELIQKETLEQEEFESLMKKAVTA